MPVSLIIAGLIIVSLAFTVAMRRKPEAAKPLKDLFKSLATITTGVVDIAMW